MELTFNVQGGNFSEAGKVSSSVKRALKELSVDAGIIKRVVVALYEAEVNVVAHAYSGHITVNIDDAQVNVVIVDKGPGIPDLEEAMRPGFSTASEEVRAMGFGAGMGLPNIKRNVDQLEIQSVVGIGTTVTMITKI